MLHLVFSNRNPTLFLPAIVSFVTWLSLGKETQSPPEGEKAHQARPAGPRWNNYERGNVEGFLFLLVNALDEHGPV